MNEDTAVIKEHDENINIVTSTHKPEDVLKELMDPEKKKILEDKVNDLKALLNKIEKKIQPMDVNHATVLLGLLKDINVEARANAAYDKGSFELIASLNEIYARLISRLNMAI